MERLPSAFTYTQLSPSFFQPVADSCASVSCEVSSDTFSVAAVFVSELPVAAFSVTVVFSVTGETDAEGRVVFEQKNKFLRGDVIEIMKPDGRNLSAAVTDIENGDGVRMPSAPHPKELLKVSLSPAPEAGEVLRVLTEKANAGGTPDTPIGA